MAHIVAVVNHLLFPGDFEYAEDETEVIKRMIAYGESRGVLGGISMLSGVPVPLEMFPTHPKMKFETNRLRDFINTRLGWIISRKAKELIENFEPEVHRFVQVDLRQQNGIPWPEPYWMFNVCTRLDTAIDEEHSTCGRVDPGKDWWFFAWPEEVPHRLAVKKTRIENLSFWADARYHGELFISDAFWVIVKEAGIRGNFLIKICRRNLTV